MATIISQCAMCKHYRSKDDTCAAFPDGIPDDVLYSRVDHSKPIEGDNGIRWTPSRPGWKHPGRARVPDEWKTTDLVD